MNPYFTNLAKQPSTNVKHLNHSCLKCGGTGGFTVPVVRAVIVSFYKKSAVGTLPCMTVQVCRVFL